MVPLLTVSMILENIKCYGSQCNFETIPESDHAQIHIESLSPFTGFGPGHYQMKA